MRALLLAIFLGSFSILSAFTLINQTDEPKMVKIEESYRPASLIPNETKRPEPLGFEPFEFTIAPNSTESFNLHEACKVLLVTITTVEKSGNRTTTRGSTTCYEPYDHLGCSYSTFTDDWGLIIHKPEDLKEKVGFSYFHENYLRNMAISQGYGIKALHPLLIEEALESDHLPAYLQ